MPLIDDFCALLRSKGCDVIENEKDLAIETSDVDEVKRCFRQHGMSFCINTSKVRNPASVRLLWTVKDVDYFGTPFHVARRIYLECVYGPKHKSRPTGKLLSRRSTSSKSAKKIDCRATMKITEIYTYPEFAVDLKIVRNLEDRKKWKMFELRQSLNATDVQVEIGKRYFVIVSKPSEHNHSVWGEESDQGAGAPPDSPLEIEDRTSSPNDFDSSFIMDSSSSNSEPNPSQANIHQLREKAKSILDLSYLISVQEPLIPRFLEQITVLENAMNDSLEKDSDVILLPTKRSKT